MDLLVSNPTKRSTLNFCLAYYWYTIMHTWYLVLMSKLSKKNSNTWLIVELSKNEVPQSGLCLALLLPNKFGWVRQISDLCSLDKCVKENNTIYWSFTISCTKRQDTSISQNLTSWCMILWTWWRISKAVCNYHTFWQIQVSVLTYGPDIYPNDGTDHTWLDNIEVYLHDIGVFHNTWAEHQVLLDMSYLAFMGNPRNQLTWILVGTIWS